MSATGKPKYESPLAVCCYYHGEQSHKIICEGLYPRSTIHLAFGDYAAWESHKETYCNSFEYERCPVARMIEECSKTGKIEED